MPTPPVIIPIDFDCEACCHCEVDIQFLVADCTGCLEGGGFPCWLITYNGESLGGGCFGNSSPLLGGDLPSATTSDPFNCTGGTTNDHKIEITGRVGVDQSDPIENPGGQQSPGDSDCCVLTFTVSCNGDTPYTVDLTWGGGPVTIDCGWV